MIGLIKKKKEFVANPFGVSLNELTSLYPEADTSQINSWNTLLHDLFFNNEFNKLPNDVVVGIEYLLPIEGMGVDLLIAGRTKSNKKIIYLIESKQWSDSYVSKIRFSNSRSDGDVLHPQIQVFRHYLAVKNYLSIGSEVDEIKPILYLGGCSSIANSIVQSSCFDTNASKVPIFNSISDIFRDILNELVDSGGLQPDDFLNAFYSPSIGIISAMNSIVSKEPPFILTKRQEETVNEIREAIKNGKKIIRIVGAGGSGKTAILLNLFVSISSNSKTYKAYFSPGAQNFKLYQSLYPSIKGTFSSTFGLRNLARRHQLDDHSILFIDEAQHNEEGLLSEFVKTGCLIVVCYDDNQVINLTNSAIDELKNFEKRSDFIGIELKESIRFNGSLLFEPTVHSFLNGETVFEADDKYDFRVFGSLDSIIDSTIDLIREHPKSTVAVVGLLSNDADTIIAKSKGKLKTDWSQEVYGIPAETRWIPYVQNKDYLSKLPLWVGTWWTPGLDFDYVVVIVGGDAKMTSTGIVPVPEQAKHFKMMVSVARKMGIPVIEDSARKQCDYIMAYLNQPGRSKEKETFLLHFSRLLKDNYYIMMTRGRKGCFVYFSKNDNKY